MPQPPVGIIPEPSPNARMMGTAGDGLHDHLMDCTRAVSGATFFAPSLEVLKSLGLP